MPIQIESDCPAKIVEVPQHLLDELELARKRLYEMNPNMSIGEQIEMQNVTDIMWRLANTKWKEIK